MITVILSEARSAQSKDLHASPFSKKCHFDRSAVKWRNLLFLLRNDLLYNTAYFTVQSMSDLQRALVDIREIRKQVAGQTQFRGYGPLAMLGSAVLAFVAVAMQPFYVPDPTHMPVHYLKLWCVTAIAALLLSAITVHTRTRRMHSGLSDEMIRMAAEQFVPVLVAGFLVTLVIVFRVPQVVWMLPGLWQILFSLGIFASCRSLPRAMLAPACWFLCTGVACLSLGNARALAPVCMGVPFVVGHIFLAAVLRFYAAPVEEDCDA